MNLTSSKTNTFTVQDLDSLLQDSYLLVVELRQGASVQYSPDLWKRCEKQVKQVQEHLLDAGVSRRSIELISLAQCALLDEVILSCAKNDARAKWASQPLQAWFFNSQQASEFLYDDMREALRQHAPDVLVLTAFQRVLMFGLLGRYSDVKHPERQQLLAALNTRAAPPVLSQLVIKEASGQQMNLLHRLRSPLVHILIVGLLLMGVWWGLGQ